MQVSESDLADEEIHDYESEEDKVEDFEADVSRTMPAHYLT